MNAVGFHNLWHGRFRHTSNQVLSLLSGDFIISSVENNGPYEICFHIKQTKTPFVANENHMKEFFDSFIVIFGLYKKFLLFVVLYFFTIIDDVSRTFEFI